MGNKPSRYGQGRAEKAMAGKFGDKYGGREQQKTARMIKRLTQELVVPSVVENPSDTPAAGSKYGKSESHRRYGRIDIDN